MALDQRSNQLRTTQIIATGTNSTNADILIYGNDAATNYEGGITALINSNIGTDVFLFVSGSSTKKTVFGGDLVASGTVYFKGQITGSDIAISSTLFVSGNSTLGDTPTDTLKLNAKLISDVMPLTDNLYDLGSASTRWKNIYTGDLHLKNDRGDWTIIEEEDFLTITNNKSGKRYKFVVEEI